MKTFKLDDYHFPFRKIADIHETSANIVKQISHNSESRDIAASRTVNIPIRGISPLKNRLCRGNRWKISESSTSSILRADRKIGDTREPENHREKSKPGSRKIKVTVVGTRYLRNGPPDSGNGRLSERNGGPDNFLPRGDRSRETGNGFRILVDHWG